MVEALLFMCGGAAVGLLVYFLKNYDITLKDPAKPEPEPKPDPKPEPEPVPKDPEDPEIYTWQTLIETIFEYDLGDIEDLKSTFLAMWRLESGMGTSELARIHINFAGMKWRQEMEGYAKPVAYEAHDGADMYCKFHGFVGKYGFIPGFIRFLDRSPYQGWREFSNDPEGFINHIGPIWAEDPNYVEKVLRNRKETDAMLGVPTDTKPSDPSEQPELAKPRIIWWPSPNRSTRNGSVITGIVLHQTHSYSLASTVNWFRQSSSKVSAHYLVGRGASDKFKGYSIVQMVNDSEKAWHAGNSSNSNTIGIEIVARDGQQLDSEQEKTLVHLIKFLMQEYSIKKEAITGHRFTGTATLCPGALFGDRSEEALKAWVDRNF